MANPASINQQFFKYLKSLIAYSAIIGGFSFLVYGYLPVKFQSRTCSYLFFFFVLLSASSHYILLLMLKQKAKFFNNFMAIIGIKFLLYFGVIGVYFVMFGSNKMAFVLNFFFFYLCFTVFEMIALLRSQNALK
jgi:hypothetical protein